MVPISNTPALFTCNRKRVIANLSLWTNTSTSSRPNFSTVWATILRIVKKAQNQRNHYFFLRQRLFSSGEDKEGQMDLWEMSHIQIHEPPRHFTINVSMIKWHLQQSSSFATSPWMMRGGVPSHLGHWRSIGYCIGEKCSKIYWQKIAFFLLQTHLLAVALRLSKFLPVILTLAPSLDGNSESLIEKQNIEDKYLLCSSSWHSASATSPLPYRQQCWCTKLNHILNMRIPHFHNLHVLYIVS